jgi:hypothetical protein
VRQPLNDRRLVTPGMIHHGRSFRLVKVTKTKEPDFIRPGKIDLDARPNQGA